ncbi:hypothetical protein B0T24DRAFT_366148 [Lasiosphaeria ovina]|uniref:Uncharacterized protein n=1 Tax=Lasiosphaeria ovina TaxID=92902 RepID=A0AAE0K552_9PEZI|nr:hypothetical protein B0T24DRAFT_366148 [Lasiosphaeria ovina]
MLHWNLLAKGMTQEQVDAEDRAVIARYEERRERLRREPPTTMPPPNQPRNQKEMYERFRAWDAVGVSRERQNELARMYGFHEKPASTDGHAKNEAVSQLRASRTRQTKDVARKTHSGRITKNAPIRAEARHQIDGAARPNLTCSRSLARGNARHTKRSGQAEGLPDSRLSMGCCQDEASGVC